MLYSFISPIKSTQQPSTSHKTPIIFEKQSTSQETSNLPADKCRGIFSNKQLCTNKVQSGLQFYQFFFAHDSKLLWYVDCIGNTSFKSIFSTNCERDSKLEWVEKKVGRHQRRVPVCLCSSCKTFIECSGEQMIQKKLKWAKDKCNVISGALGVLNGESNITSVEAKDAM